MIATMITFIVSHPGPAEHFAVFAEELGKKSLECTLIARDVAWDNLKNTRLNAVERVIYAIEDLGYYPIEKVEQFQSLRTTQVERKNAFFQAHGIENPKGKKAVSFRDP